MISYQFIKYIYELKNKMKYIKIIKQHKKNKFTIKDGIVKFTIDLKNLNCQICNKIKKCSLKKCEHIYYILLYHLKLDIYKLLNFLSSSIENECIICMRRLQHTKTIYQCLDCGKFYHHKCINKCNAKYCMNCFTPFN